MGGKEMEYVLLLIVVIQTGVMIYLLMNPKKVTVITKEQKQKVEEDEMELKRKEKIEKDWQKLFNYNEGIATWGYKQ